LPNVIHSRMPNISSFVTEIPLKTTNREESLLRKRFWSAKQQYNALLGEGLRRLRTMRADSLFKEAKTLYKQKGKKKEAQVLFKKLAVKYFYREYDLHAYCKQWNKKGSFLSIGARISQKIAKRAFDAIEKYRKGIRGKPRFKGYRGLQSIEDNSIDANLRLKDHTLHYLGIELPLLYNSKDPIHYHGMNSKIKYARLVKRNFNGIIRYYAQFVCEGKPWIKSKNQIGESVVGLDMVPQTIAIVSPEIKHAQLKIFADELKPLKQKKKEIQKKLARQFRSNNPTCFQSGKWCKKDKWWKLKQGKSIKGKRLES